MEETKNPFEVATHDLNSCTKTDSGLLDTDLSGPINSVSTSSLCGGVTQKVKIFEQILKRNLIRSKKDSKEYSENYFLIKRCHDLILSRNPGEVAQKILEEIQHNPTIRMYGERIINFANEIEQASLSRHSRVSSLTFDNDSSLNLDVEENQ